MTPEEFSKQIEKKHPSLKIMRLQDFLQKQETLLCGSSTVILGLKVFKEALLKGICSKTWGKKNFLH